MKHLEIVLITSMTFFGVVSAISLSPEMSGLGRQMLDPAVDLSSLTTRLIGRLLICAFVGYLALAMWKTVFAALNRTSPGVRQFEGDSIAHMRNGRTREAQT